VPNFAGSRDPEGAAAAAGDREEAETLDGQTLERLRELGVQVGKDVLGEVIGLFLSRKDEVLETLREACRARDAETFERAAHSLKGSAANLGALRLSGVAAELEKRGREAELDGCAGRIEELEREFAAAESQLERFLAAPGG